MYMYIYIYMAYMYVQSQPNFGKNVLAPVFVTSTS